jgi:lysophospholipase L1-like esterase
VILTIIAGIIIYPFVKSSRLPKNRPSTFLQRPPTNDGRSVIVLAGDSLTHGLIGYGYVKILLEELDMERFRLINAGVNAHLAWNLLERLDEIIDCQPSIITVLIGTNDANAATSEKEGKAYMKNMKLPRMPDLVWFREILQSIVNRLQNETSASIALLSIPTIGEIPDHPAFKLSLDYGNTVKEVAMKTGVTYLPLQEQMVAYLESNPGSPKYPIEREKVQMFLSIFKRYLLGRSWDSIAEGAGFKLHSDYLHLNSVSARMVADMNIQFIKSTQSF